MQNQNIVKMKKQWNRKNLGPQEKIIRVYTQQIIKLKDSKEKWTNNLSTHYLGERIRKYGTFLRKPISTHSLTQTY